jgi:hypothetical protein
VEKQRYLQSQRKNFRDDDGWTGGIAPSGMGML